MPVIMNLSVRHFDLYTLADYVRSRTLIVPHESQERRFGNVTRAAEVHRNAESEAPVEGFDLAVFFCSRRKTFRATRKTKKVFTCIYN